MIKLINLILENNLREYSEEEKKKMGIPSGATSRGGVWYVGDKYAGKVVGGKFVAAAKTQPAGAGGKPPIDKTKTKTPATSPNRGDTSTAKSSTPQQKKSDEPPRSYLQVRDSASPKERKLVDKVHSMWDKVADSDFMSKHVGNSYPSAEFEKMTGIPKDAARIFSDTVQDYETPFVYHNGDDTVYIQDPMDV